MDSLQVQARRMESTLPVPVAGTLPGAQHQAVEKGLLQAYRWQYILSGAHIRIF